MFVLTDENPEIRLFILSQGLNVLFDLPLKLNSPVLKGITITDCNEIITIENLFNSVTNQAMRFQEHYTAGEQLSSNALADAV